MTSSLRGYWYDNQRPVAIYLGEGKYWYIKAGKSGIKPDRKSLFGEFTDYYIGHITDVCKELNISVPEAFL